MKLQQISKKRSALIAVIVVLFIVFIAFTVLIFMGVTEKNSFRVKAALLYSSTSEKRQYEDTYSHLRQSFMANLDVTLLDADKEAKDLEKYDILYLDESLTETENMKDEIISYVEGGGNVFVPNAFMTYFEPEFFGAKEIVKLESFPKNIVYPGVAEDFLEFQGIIRDFETVYEMYAEYESLSNQDYGYGIVPDSAKSIAEWGRLSLYGINGFGEGTVLYTNPLLPNAFSINGFSLRKTRENQGSFAGSTATANQLILGEYASIVSKAKYGYSVKRVLGSFGNSDMAWQINYGNITDFENGSATTVGEVCKEYGVVPSFNLIRNAYKKARFETVTYILNKNGSYNYDFNVNPCFGGAHIIENNKYLSLSEIPDDGNAFEDNTDFLQMAYPDVLDYNGDGIADMVVGSSDGKFYLFEGETNQDGWKVKERRFLTDAEGNELSVKAYSAPALADMDSDGILDLVSGSEKGDVLFFKGTGDMCFEKPEALIETIDMTRTMPSLGDVNNDGRLDVAIGSVDGGIDIYSAEDKGFKYTGSIVLEGDIFMASCLYDYNKDGFADIVYGNFYGNIKKMKNNGDDSFAFDGFYDSEEMTYNGNKHLKFGNNCVPQFFDINGDGADDLIAGALEYGLAIPIDSPYFTAKERLSAQLDYIKENKFYSGVNFYTIGSASKESEAEEINLHKKAFDTYGISYKNKGVNMHLGEVSDIAPEQSMQSVRDAGFLWCSGAQWINKDSSGYNGAENILACPFFMDFEKRDFMITATNPMQKDYAYLSAKYDLPILACGEYRDEQKGRAMTETIVSYQKKNSYNLVKEDQLIKSAAAAYNAELVQKDKNNGTVELSARALRKNFGLYDKDFAECVGIKIDFAERIDISKVLVDADVWRYDSEKKDLYLGLNEAALIKFDAESENAGYKYIIAESEHLIGVNIPADIEQKDGKTVVKFKEDGMMQVNVSGEVKDYTPDWKMTFENGITTLTKFGAKSELEFSLK